MTSAGIAMEVPSRLAPLEVVHIWSHHLLSFVLPLTALTFVWTGPHPWYVSVLFIAPLAIARDMHHWHTATATSVLSVAWLGVVSTALAVLVFYRLIVSAGPTFFSYINFLIPIVALVAGIAIRGEPFSWQAVAALALILGGLGLSRWGDPLRGAVGD